MAIKPTATLAGEPIVGGAPISWTLSPGVQPNSAEIPVRPGAVARLLGTAKNSVELKLGELTVKGLSVVGTAVSSDPYVARVVVVDRRFWWSRTIVQRNYNMRRRVSKVRRGNWTDALLTEAVSDIQYRAYSCIDGAKIPWSAIAILKDVFARVDKEATIKDGPVPLDIPVEDLAIDGDGASAVMAALASIPSVQPSITVGGEITWDTITSGNETTLVGTGSPLSPGGAGPEIIGQGHITPVDRSPQIPMTFRVLFTPEIELRVECLDIGGSGTDAVATQQRSATNVAPVSDFEMKIGGVTYAPGTYLPIALMMANYTGGVPAGSLVPTIDDALLRRASIPGYQTRILAQFNVLANEDTRAVLWMQRIQSLLTHYRTTYQLPRVLTDRLLDIRPYLVATIDITSGQRAPAMVYSDHSLFFAQIPRNVVADGHGGHELPWMQNVSGYPGADKDPDSTKSPAPATVQVVDVDQGIIRIAYHNGPFGSYRGVAPSKINTGAGGSRLPAHNLRKSAGSDTLLTADSITSGGKVATLAAESRAAVYLTVVPATTLYQVTVTAADIAAATRTPAAMKSALLAAKGPPVELRMPAAVETARINWKTGSTGELIEKTLGLGLTAPPARITGTGGETVHVDDVPALFALNDTDYSSADTGASLKALAIALATSWVSNLISLAEGSMTGGMLPSAQIVGRVSSITHTLGARGELTTRYALSPALPAFDLLQYLPPGARRVVQKTVV